MPRQRIRNEDRIRSTGCSSWRQRRRRQSGIPRGYGFRPKGGQHDALDALAVGITDKKVNFIFDADVRSFFDEVSQRWLIRFVEHRIGDPRIIRLIQKWFKAGVLEDGVVTVSEKGTGAGVGDFATARQRLPALCVRSVG